MFVLALFFNSTWALLLFGFSSHWLTIARDAKRASGRRWAKRSITVSDPRLTNAERIQRINGRTRCSLCHCIVTRTSKYCLIHRTWENELLHHTFIWLPCHAGHIAARLGGWVSWWNSKKALFTAHIIFIIFIIGYCVCTWFTIISGGGVAVLVG